MAKVKRRGSDDSHVRDRIISAAADIISQEGFAAVTAPRLAQHIGLQRPIIYYYFDDMDQILLAAVRHGYELTKAAALARMSTSNAKDILWQIFENASAPLSELTNYSLRGEPFKLLLAEIIDDLRLLFSAAIEVQANDAARGRDLSPTGLAFLIQATSTALATERRLGLSLGHADVRVFFERAFGISASST